MPLLKFKITSNIDDETRVELAVAMTEITERLLRKSPAFTAIIIEKFSPDSWTVGGKTLRSQNLNSFCLEIAVTEATNTKAEFASFIDSVFAKMTEKLAPCTKQVMSLSMKFPHTRGVLRGDARAPFHCNTIQCRYRMTPHPAEYDMYYSC